MHFEAIMLKFLLILLVFASNDLVKAENHLLPHKFLIVGGYGNRQDDKKYDILCTNTFKVEQSAEDFDTKYSTGFNTALGPTICGGQFDLATTTLCHVYSETSKTWQSSDLALTGKRQNAAVIQVNRDKALLIGGENYFHLKSIETMTSSGSTLAQTDLPFSFSFGCAVKVNDTHGLIIGGQQDKTTSAATHYINLNTLETTPGPQLIQKRAYFGCAASNDQVVVAGGVGADSDRDSDKLGMTEILDLTMSNAAWVMGPPLPVQVKKPSLVASNKGILAIGGRGPNVSDQKSILRLSCNNGANCQWIKEAELKGKYGRYWFNAIPIIASKKSNFLSRPDMSSGQDVLPSGYLTNVCLFFNLCLILGYLRV